MRRESPDEQCLPGWYLTLMWAADWAAGGSSYENGPAEALRVRDQLQLAIHVVLMHPEIHWNTGNAGRTCLAAGAVLHLVAPLGFSLDERQVKRAGLDYWQHVDVRVWPDWKAFESELPA